MWNLCFRTPASGLSCADFICHVDIYQRSVTPLQQLQSSSSAGGDTDSVMNCWGLLLEPPAQIIDTVGRWLYFLQGWKMSVARLHTLFPCVYPVGGSLTEFVLTLQMFNERTATAAGRSVLMTWHKTHVCFSTLKQPDRCSNGNSLQAALQ